MFGIVLSFVGAARDPFRTGVLEQGLAPGGAAAAVWTPPGHEHGTSNGRLGLRGATAAAFGTASPAMAYEAPEPRPIPDAERLRRRIVPDLDGHGPLREAAAWQGFFERV